MLRCAALSCPIHQFCWKRPVRYSRVAPSLEDCHCVILYYILNPFPSFHFHYYISRSKYFCSRLRIDDYFLLNFSLRMMQILFHFSFYFSFTDFLNMIYFFDFYLNLFFTFLIINSRSGPGATLMATSFKNQSHR